MYPKTNLCFMCLNNSSNINVTNIIAKEIENLMPEIEIFKMGIPLRICSECEKNILFFSVFKQACLVNIIQLQASITKAQSSNSPAAQNEYVEPGCAAKVVIRQNAVQVIIKKDILKTTVPKPNPVQEKNNENYAVNNDVNVSSVNVNSIAQTSDEVSVKEEKDVIQSNPEFSNDHVIKIENDNCEMSNIVNCNNVNENPNDSELYDDHFQEIRNKNSDIDNIDDDMNVDNDFHLTSIMKKQCGKGSMDIFVKEESSNIIMNQEQEGENDNSNMNNTANSNNVNVNKTDHINKETNLENGKTAQEINYQNTEKNSIINNIHEENSNDRIYDEEVKIKKKDAIQDIANNIDDEMEVDDDYHLTSFMKKQRRKSTMEIFIKEESSNNNLINRKQERENENCKINNANSNNVTVNNTDHMNNETGIENEKSELQLNYENTEKNSVIGNILEEISNDCIYGDVMKKQCDKSSMEIFIKAEIPKSVIQREQEIQNKNCNINNTVNSNNFDVSNTENSTNETSHENEKATLELNCQNREKKSIADDILEEDSNDPIYENIMKKQCGKGSLEICIKEEIPNYLIKRGKEMENKNCKIKSYVNEKNTDHLINETNPENEKVTQNTNCRNKEKETIEDDEVNSNDRTYDDEGKQDKITTSQINNKALKVISIEDILEEIHNSNKLSGDVILEVSNKKRKHNEIDTNNYTHEASTNDAQSGKTNTTQTFDSSITQLDNTKKIKKNNNSASEIHDLTVEEMGIEEDTREENSTGHKFCNERDIKNKDHNTSKHINCRDDNIIHENHVICQNNINKAHSRKASETQTFDIPIQIDEEKESKKDNSTVSEIYDLTLDDDIIEVTSNDGDTHKVNTSKVENDKASPIKVLDIPIILLDEDNSKDNNTAPEIYDLTLDEICIREDSPDENPTGNKLCNEPTRGVSNKDCETKKNNYNNDNVNSTDNSTTQAFDISTTQLDNQKKNKIDKNLTSEEVIIVEDILEASEIGDKTIEEISVEENIMADDSANHNFSDAYNTYILNRKLEEDIFFFCVVCTKKFTTKDALEIHLKNHSNYFPCSKCNCWFEDKTKLMKHREDVHEEFVCTLCNKYLSNKLYWNRHKEHCRITKFKCSICHEMFSYAFMLRKHIQLKHLLNKKFKCDICKKLCISTRELNLHRIEHLEKNVFRCWICCKVHISQDELDLHIKREHVYNKESYNKDLHCPVCHKMFKHKSAMTLHMKIHPKPKFSCHICYRSCLTKTSLKLHLRSHRGS